MKDTRFSFHSYLFHKGSVQYDQARFLLLMLFLVAPIFYTDAQTLTAHLRCDRLNDSTYELFAYIDRISLYEESAKDDTPRFYIYDPVNFQGQFLGFGNIIHDSTQFYHQHVTYASCTLNLKDPGNRYYDTLEYFDIIFTTNKYLQPYGTEPSKSSYYLNGFSYETNQGYILISRIYHSNYDKLSSPLNNGVHLDTIGFGFTFDALYGSTGAWDSDHDSIVVEYVEPLQKLFKPGIFIGKYSFFPYAGYWQDSFSLSEPFRLFCFKQGNNCKVNPNSYPPLGMYIDPKDGDIIIGFDNYDNKKAQGKTGFPMTYRISEYRKDINGNFVILSENYLNRYFDMRFTNNKFGYSFRDQASRFLSHPKNYYLVVGDSLDIDFQTTKSGFSGRNYINQIFWNREFYNSSFTIKNPGANNKTLNFKWTPRVDDVSERYHPLTIYVMSDSSSDDTTWTFLYKKVPKQMNSQTIHFYVYRKPHVQIEIDSIRCNHIYAKCDSIELPDNWHFSWNLVSEKGDTVWTSSVRIAHLLVNKSGKFKLNLDIHGDKFWSEFHLDTALSFQSVLEVELPASESICINDCITLHPKIKFSNGSVVHIWDNGNILQDAPTYTVCDTGVLIRLSSTDDSGCTALNEVYISGKDTLPFSLGADTTLCSGSYVQVRIPHYDEKINFVWQDGNLKDSVRVFSAPAVISAHIQAANGCWSFDHKLLNSPPPPSDSVTISGNLCPGQQLALGHQPAPGDSVTQYNWQIGGNYYSGNPVNVMAQSDFDYSLTMQYKAGGLQCAYTAMGRVDLYDKPPVHIDYPPVLCQSALPFQLKIKETYPKINWKDGSHVFGPVINPVQGKVVYGPFKHWVEVEDSKGCKATDTAFIEVELPDDITGLPAQQVFCWTSTGLQLPARSKLGVDLQWQSSGSGAFSIIGGKLFYIPSKDDYGQYIHFTAGHDLNKACSKTQKSFDILFQGASDAAIALSDTAGCAPLKVDMNLTGQPVDRNDWYLNEKKVATGNTYSTTLGAGDHRVYSMYTINGCNGQTAQRQIHVEEPAKFQGFDIQKTGRTQFSLDYKTSKATQSQVWTIESGDTSGDRPFLLEIFTTGVQHINLLMTDMNGCRLSADTLFPFQPGCFLLHSQCLYAKQRCAERKVPSGGERLRLVSESVFAHRSVGV